MNRKLLSGVAAMLCICMCFTSCAFSAESTPEQKPITIALTQDMLSFDPIKTTDIYSEAILRCVYTSLYDFDENLQLRPKLVKTATAIDDYTWRIEIHSGVKFHDGSSLTTDDVIFSIERALTGERTQKPLEVVKGVEKVDDTTFLLHAKEPYADILSLFAKAETSILSKKTVETPGYDFTTPVGSGPFQLISREVDSKVSLGRFDGYYLEKAASPLLDFVVLVTEQERTAAFFNGDVDILFSVSAYDCDKLKLSENVNLLQSPSPKIEYLSLNTTHPPLNDSKVRLAISYAINRDKIARDVYHGYGVPSSSLIPAGIMGYAESPVSYDPEKAKALLREAGYENGFEFTAITVNTIRKNTMEYIKLDLAAVGITFNYNLVTMQEAVDAMNANEHGGILVGWAFNPDPNGVLPVLLGTGSGKTMNSSNYSNPTVDDLIKQGRGEIDSEKREQIYKQINQIVTQEAPIVVLLNPMSLSAAHSDIAGVKYNSQGLFQYESLYRAES